MVLIITLSYQVQVHVFHFHTVFSVSHRVQFAHSISNICLSLGVLRIMPSRVPSSETLVVMLCQSSNRKWCVADVMSGDGEVIFKNTVYE